MFGVSPFSGTSTTWRAAETQSAINATRSVAFPQDRRHRSTLPSRQRSRMGLLPEDRRHDRREVEVACSRFGRLV